MTATTPSSLRGTVAALAVSPTHTFSKRSTPSVELVAGIGVVGDAHAGAQVRHRSRVAADPTQPNLRQVHFIGRELFERVAEFGFAVGPGDLGENVTTAGVDLLALPTGTTLAIGDEALVTLTGLRNPCRQINGFEDGLLDVMRERQADGGWRRLAGVMAVVVRGGEIRVGDPIVATPPAITHPLVRV